MRITICTLLFSLSLLTFGISKPALAQRSHRCDNRDLSGAFGFSINGSNPAVGPYSFVGRFEADGNGKVTSGKGIQSVNGDIARPSFTGTYSVNPDCMGQAVLSFSGGGSATLQFVIEANGTQVAIIVAGSSGRGGENEVGTATKQFFDPAEDHNRKD